VERRGFSAVVFRLGLAEGVDMASPGFVEASESLSRALTPLGVFGAVLRAAVVEGFPGS
jgi:hypothetical protein